MRCGRRERYRTALEELASYEDQGETQARTIENLKQEVGELRDAQTNTHATAQEAIARAQVNTCLLHCLSSTFRCLVNVAQHVFALQVSARTCEEAYGELQVTAMIQPADGLQLHFRGGLAAAAAAHLSPIRAATAAVVHAENMDYPQA